MPPRLICNHLCQLRAAIKTGNANLISVMCVIKSTMAGENMSLCKECDRHCAPCFRHSAHLNGPGTPVPPHRLQPDLFPVILSTLIASDI